MENKKDDFKEITDIIEKIKKMPEDKFSLLPDFFKRENVTIFITKKLEKRIKE